MHLTTGMIVLAAALAASVIDPAGADAQVAPPGPAAQRLGTAGQTIITSEWKLDIDFESYDLGDGESVDRTEYDVHVGIDRVVGPGLTGGVRLGFSGWSQDFDAERRFDLAGRFGALVRMGDTTTWWPRLGLAYGSTSFADRTSAILVKTWTLNLSAPFLFTVGRHFLIGIGPTYEHDLSARFGSNEGEVVPKRRSYGLHGFLGFWF